ncbi:MAG: hypothetical protein GXO54_00190 [Chloroflexi bacterium]|nr:hypothetical protein [Chloroflexota bacterium]
MWRREPTLEYLLAQCLDEIKAGRRTFEECLAAYPAHRDELEPLLALALDLQRLPDPEPSPSFRRNAKIRLMNRIRAEQDRMAAVVATPTVENSSAKSVTRGWWRRFWGWTTASPQSQPGRRTAMIWAVVFAVVALFIGGGGVVYAAQDALPGEPLYSVKETVEEVQLLLADPVEDVQLHLDFAARRLEEAQQLLQEGRVDLAVKAMEMAEEHWQAALVVAEQLRETQPEAFNALVAEAQALKAQAQALEALKEQLMTQAQVGATDAPEQVVERLSQVEERMEQVLERADEVFASVPDRGTPVAAHPQVTATETPTETATPDHDESMPGEHMTETPEPSETPDDDEYDDTMPTETSTPEPSETPDDDDDHYAEPTRTPAPTETSTPEPSETPDDDHDDDRDDDHYPEPTTTPEPTQAPAPTETSTPEPTATVEPTHTPEPDDDDDHDMTPQPGDDHDDEDDDEDDD